jgi:hypothetical protein
LAVALDQASKSNNILIYLAVFGATNNSSLDLYLKTHLCHDAKKTQWYAACVHRLFFLISQGDLPPILGPLSTLVNMSFLGSIKWSGRRS